jgi:hypothetical protein
VSGIILVPSIVGGGGYHLYTTTLLHAALRGASYTPGHLPSHQESTVAVHTVLYDMGDSLQKARITKEGSEYIQW